MQNIDDHIYNLDFLKDDDLIPSFSKTNYKVIVADDDEDIHQLTDLLLKDFEFEGRKLNLIHSYSAQETKELLLKNRDIAVIILDVVMESMDAGLKIIDYIRRDLRNKNIRILIRTGQPGYAPEDSVIREYDINDYKLKTELTKQKLFTALYSCLRSYRDLVEIERNRNALEELVKITEELFKQKSLEEFLLSIFNQIRIFKKYQNDFCSSIDSNGFIYKLVDNHVICLVGSGKYHMIQYNDSPFKNLIEMIKKIDWDGKNIHYPPKGLIFYNKGVEELREYVYIEVDSACYDDALIELLVNNYAMALENYQLNDLLLKSHEDVIFTLIETIERHSSETSNHVKRVSQFMSILAEKYGVQISEINLVKMASVLHDIGKIGIPDSILKKPARLTPEEFDIIKRHTEIGYNILRHNEHPIFKTAAIIAKNHHEKYDGSGYPTGLIADEIPIYSRMMAIIDVFDALISDRCYKKAHSFDETVEIMKKESGKHFDPMLLELFFENINEIMKVHEAFKE